MAADVLIVGGGVIGLSAAYVLAREGVFCTVLDAGEVGRGASWAGAGLIPPDRARKPINPSIELRSWSAVLHAEWAGALREETGIDNGFRRDGGVDVALDAAEEQALRAQAGRWRVEGIDYERVDAPGLAAVEPALGPRVRMAYYLPDRGQIRNPRHLRALAAAATRRGVTLLANRPVLGFEAKGGRVLAVRTEAGPIACGQVVVAAGAWSARLLATLSLVVPTPPLKGQIVLLRHPGRPLRRIVEHGKNYLVPRDDGRILVGATEEDAGFDARSTESGASGLLAKAIALCPVLAEAEVERAWAGLRPGSVDTRPYLGAAPGFDNLVVATGHKRAGLQLSPATAELVADLVLGRPPRIDLASFRPGREPSPPAEEAVRS